MHPSLWRQLRELPQEILQRDLKSKRLNLPQCPSIKALSHSLTAATLTVHLLVGAGRYNGVSGSIDVSKRCIRHYHDATILVVDVPTDQFKAPISLCLLVEMVSRSSTASLLSGANAVSPKTANHPLPSPCRWSHGKLTAQHHNESPSLRWSAPAQSACGCHPWHSLHLLHSHVSTASFETSTYF